jgi:hypothetical protein
LSASSNAGGGKVLLLFAVERMLAQLRVVFLQLQATGRVANIFDCAVPRCARGFRAFQDNLHPIVFLGHFSILQKGRTLFNVGACAAHCMAKLIRSKYFKGWRRMGESFFSQERV